MSAWLIDSVEALPSGTLVRWAALEVLLCGTGQPWTLHLARWSCEDGQEQVCSLVEAFDPVTARATSRSGRVYQLKGQPGLDSGASYVWARWNRVWDIQQQRNVTKEVFAALQAANTGARGGMAD